MSDIDKNQNASFANGGVDFIEITLIRVSIIDVGQNIHLKSKSIKEQTKADITWEELQVGLNGWKSKG